MTISANKCTEFVVNPHFSNTGKPKGFAVLGRAAKHDKFKIVKWQGQEQLYGTADDAHLALEEIAPGHVVACNG